LKPIKKTTKNSGGTVDNNINFDSIIDEFHLKFHEATISPAPKKPSVSRRPRSVSAVKRSFSKPNPSKRQLRGKGHRVTHQHSPKSRVYTTPKSGKFSVNDSAYRKAVADKPHVPPELLLPPSHVRAVEYRENNFGGMYQRSSRIAALNRAIDNARLTGMSPFQHQTYRKLFHICDRLQQNIDDDKFPRRPGDHGAIIQHLCRFYGSNSHAATKPLMLHRLMDFAMQYPHDLGTQDRVSQHAWQIAQWNQHLLNTLVESELVQARRQVPSPSPCKAYCCMVSVTEVPKIPIM
jgi:Fe-S cluster biosynthesis and repair protein YggX